MALKSWDDLTLQQRRNRKKLYNHLYAETSISLVAWNSLPGVTRYSTRRLWNEIATKVNDTADVPLWKDLTYQQRRSRKLRWTLLYTELAGTTQRTLSFTVTDDEDEPTAISGAKVTAEGYEDYTDTVTSDSTHTSFTIELTAVTEDDS